MGAKKPEAAPAAAAAVGRLGKAVVGRARRIVEDAMSSDEDAGEDAAAAAAALDNDNDKDQDKDEAAKEDAVRRCRSTSG